MIKSWNSCRRSWQPILAEIILKMIMLFGIRNRCNVIFISCHRLLIQYPNGNKTLGRWTSSGTKATTINIIRTFIKATKAQRSIREIRRQTFRISNLASRNAIGSCGVQAGHISFSLFGRLPTFFYQARQNSLELDVPMLQSSLKLFRYFLAVSVTTTCAFPQ